MGHFSARFLTVTAAWRFRTPLLVGLVAIAGCGGNPNTPPPPVPQLTISCPQAVETQSSDENPVPVDFAAPVAGGGVAPLNTVCTPASGSMFNPGPTTVNCRVSDSRAITASCSFSVTVRTPPKLRFTRFMAFGDSITWGTEPPPFPTLFPEPPPPTAYPRQLEIRLVSRYRLQQPVMVNAGWPGEKAWVDGVRRFRGELLQHRPEVVILMEGTNDLLDLNLDLPMNALGTMVREAKSQGVQVILATIPPQRLGGARQRNPLVVGQIPTLNERIKGLATAEAVFLADVNAALDLSMIGFDDLHPTARGMEAIADALLAVIQDKLEVTANPAPAPAWRR